MKSNTYGMFDVDEQFEEENELHELKEQLKKMEKEAESSKKIRNFLIIAILLILYFLLFWFDDPGDFFSKLTISIIIAAIHFEIHRYVFEAIVKKEEADERKIQPIRRRISTLETEKSERQIAVLKKKIEIERQFQELRRKRMSNTESQQSDRNQ